MTVLEQSRDMPFPAPLVWTYLIALEQVPLWEHGVPEVRFVSGGPPRLGSRLTARRIYGGREVVLEGEVVAYEEGVSATIALRGGPHRESRVTYEVRPLARDRSTVTYRAVVGVRPPLSLLGPLLPALGRAETRRNLERLERRIAAGIPPGSNLPTPDR
jgi:uncharacterized protein YndB with AHSA1/START domain